MDSAFNRPWQRESISANLFLWPRKRNGLAPVHFSLTMFDDRPQGEIYVKDEIVVKPEEGLKGLLGILRRRRLVFLAAILVVPLVALLVSLSQERQYTATASLLFQGSNNNADAAARQAATNNELVGLPIVAEMTARDLGGKVTGAEVQASINVDAGSSIADIGKISATTNTPSLSARMANAYSRAFIKFKRRADQSQVQQAISLIKRSLATLSPSELVGRRGHELEDRLTRLKVQQDLQTGKAELVQPALWPSSPSSPKTFRNVVLGVILGAMLGLGLLALLERLDRHVRSVDDLEKLFGVPILARIPRSRKLRASRDDMFSLDNVLQTPEAEAFRLLRVNLRYFNVNGQLRSILVTSPEMGDGKSTVARCLAAVMAEMGDNVVLLEADLRRGRELSHDADGHGEIGLSNLLVSPVTFDAVTEVEIAEHRRLSVLPSGPVPPNPGELLESERMRELIVRLEARFDIVVIDSPPVSVGDALALAPHVSGILAVAGLGKTTGHSARDFTKQFAMLGMRPLGVVANFTETEHGQYAYYKRAGLAARS